MHLLVGLGNPGAKYALNRHNVGFMALDVIARRWGFGPWRQRFQGEAAEGRVGDVRILALKPTTFMNLSGQSVGAAVRFLKLDPGAVTVLHDEIDLAFCKLRVKTGGGHGGHNGIRDIANHIGADFRRVRIGVGHPGDKEKVHGHVLHDFAKAEMPDVEKLLDAIADELPRLLGGDEAAFMSRVALVMNPPPPKPPRRPEGGKKGPEGGGGPGGGDGV
jgi:PTH1 family peptidyl-tRNA hydrolase